jgi:hypothetical protein
MHLRAAVVAAGQRREQLREQLRRRRHAGFAGRAGGRAGADDLQRVGAERAAVADLRGHRRGALGA